jgi:hypothetical protein
MRRLSHFLAGGGYRAEEERTEAAGLGRSGQQQWPGSGTGGQEEPTERRRRTGGVDNGGPWREGRQRLSRAGETTDGGFRSSVPQSRCSGGEAGGYLDELPKRGAWPPALRPADGRSSLLPSASPGWRLQGPRHSTGR